MRAFAWFVLFCLASSTFAGLAFWSSSNGPLNVLPRVSGGLDLVRWLVCRFAAAISFIGVMVVATARFIVGGHFKLFLKRRLLTGLNFVEAVVVFFTIIYAQV